MVIAHFALANKDQELFLKSLPQDTHLFYTDKTIFTHLEEILEVEVLNVFIQTEVSREIMDSLPKLKLIVTRSTGFDHIDVGYARSKGIVVCNVPAYGSNTVAEHTFALLLALSKQIPNLTNRTKQFDFEYHDLLGFDLHGKTLGVIGAGKIGKNVIQIAKGFDMKVLAHDIYQDDFASEALQYSYVEIDNLLERSDIVTLHTPLNDYTCNILNRTNLSKMKSGVVFVNTSRGCLIKNSDLLFALDNGIIGAAGLDAIEDEEQMFLGHVNDEQKELLSRQNVIYTPHSAFYTKEALQRILVTTVENIQQWRQNQLINAVS